MNKQKFDVSIQQYKLYLKKSNVSENDINDRKMRIEYYQSLNKEKLTKMNDDEFVEFIGKLWASAVYGNKKYLTDKIISDNNGLENVKKMLINFLFGKEDICDRWDLFMKEAKNFGPSYMSELLGYYYPDKYALANKQVINALDYLEYPNMPHYNYQFTGKKYLEICNICKDIGFELTKNEIPCENLLAVDYFLWEISIDTVNNEREEDKNIEKVEMNKEEQVFIHNEIKDKIVEIGTLLGFEAKAEVRVAKGATVDAIWSMNIGNMGRVIYVFEVQTKGSIDSLIMNLQKANNNKAVQAVVAVSDDVQLNKIKEESEGLLNDLKLWNYHDVIKVYNSLSLAMSEVNKLGLVPKDF